MSNTNILIERLAKTSLALLKNNMVLTKMVSRDYEDDFVEPGDTVSIRKPVDYTVRTGEVAQVQDNVRGKVQVKVDKIAGVDMQFGAKELTLEVPDMIRSLDLNNAMARCAQQVDRDLFLEAYRNTWNWVGTPGQLINSYADFLVAPQRLTEMAVADTSRKAILTGADYYAMVGSNAALTAQQSAATDALRKANLGAIANMDTFQSEMVPTHTVGTKSGTPLINGVNQGVVAYSAVKDTNISSLITNGWSNSQTVLKQGDVFTVGGVYAVNPATKDAQVYLQQFVATADIVSDGSGNATITCSPALIISGAYQTVTAAPADDAPIVVMGTASTGYRQNLAFDPMAFTLVVRPMAKIDLQYEAYATDKDLGLTLKVSRDGDITNNRSITRIDILYGVKAVRPGLATRFSGT